VELRFCAPGEDYVYQPEEEIPSAGVSALPRESRGGMPLPVVIAGAAGLLAVAIAGVWWASSGTAKKDTVASKDGLYPIGATADHPVKKAEPPATKPPEAAPSKKDEKLRAALQKASEAVKAQDWKAAKEAYQEALAADPSNAAAKAGFDRVSLEEVAFEAFQEGKTLLTQEKWMDAAERFAAVPAGTLLFEQAKAQAKYARSRAADKLRQEAQRALKAKDYRSAITVAKAWLVIDPSSSEALRIVEQARAARSHRPPHGRNPGARSSPKTGASEARAKEAKAYLVKGMESYNKRKFELAVKHFKRAIELDPVGQRLTHRALGSAYARMGKMDKAAEQYRIYLRKNPTAPDAPQIRQILAKYDASKGGG
jgi:tetratricopeptide (TPR) repeat protein